MRYDPIEAEINRLSAEYTPTHEDMIDAIAAYTSVPDAMPLTVDESSIVYDDDAERWTASARNADGATFLMELDATVILLTLVSADSLPHYNQADFNRFVANRGDCANPDASGMAFLPSGDYTDVQFGGEGGLIIGDGSVIGDNQRIGDISQLGDGCKIGNSCTLGWCGEIGANAVIGDDFHMEDGCHIGDHAIIGARFYAGDELDLGVGCRVGDGAIIGNDCRFWPGCTLGANSQVGKGAEYDDE